MNMTIKVSLCGGDIKAICSCSYVVVYAAMSFVGFRSRSNYQ